MPDFSEYPIPPEPSQDEPQIFENKSGLADDLKFLASMPELCDVSEYLFQINLYPIERF